MRLGLFTDAFPERPLGEVLDWLAAELPALRDVEVGTGGYSPAPHCDRAALVASASARDEWLCAIAERGFRLAALNASGNPLEVPEHERALRETIRLAALLGVDAVVCMSGGRPELAGGAWFPGVEDEVERYWRERVLPAWRELSALAQAERESLRLCLELEPGSAAYTVSTALRLCEACPNVRVNLDPSHFFWQGVDPLAAVRALGDRIGFAHGKDTVLDEQRVAVDGLLDRTAWRYATAGHGHGEAWWRAFADELRREGYDGVLSIEWEDALVPPAESVLEAALLLERLLVEVPA